MTEAVAGRTPLPSTRRHIWAATAAAAVAAFGITLVLQLDRADSTVWEPQLWAFVAYAAVYIGLTGRALVATGAMELAAWARDVDARRTPWRDRLFGRSVGASLPVYAALYGFVAGLYVLPQAGSIDPLSASRLTVAAVLTVVLAWLLLHTAFLLQYAYLYHRPPGGGLEFPATDRPGPVDFAYFAGSVATTFGTTDVSVTSSRMRGVLLVHMLLSFVFNTAVLALTVTVVFG